MSSEEMDEESDDSDDAPIFQPSKAHRQKTAPLRTEESDLGSTTSTVNTCRGHSDISLQVLLEVLKSLGNEVKQECSAKQLPSSSVRLISSAVETFESTPILRMNVNEKLDVTTKTAQFLAEALSAVCANGRAPLELISLRETTKELGNLWKDLLPELESMREQAKRHAEEAAELERKASVLMLSKQGIIELITKAFSR